MPQTSSSHRQIEAPEFVFHLKYTYIYFRLKTEQIPYSQIKNCLPRNTISSTAQVSRSVQTLKSIRSHQSTISKPHSIPTLEIPGTKAYFLKETRIPYPLRIMMIQKKVHCEENTSSNIRKSIIRTLFESRFPDRTACFGRRHIENIRETERVTDPALLSDSGRRGVVDCLRHLEYRQESAGDQRNTDFIRMHRRRRGQTDHSTGARRASDVPL